MSAGARTVVASLWKVDDEATAELMNQFYQAMLSEELPPAAALQKAKQAMQRHQRWHHPYYWAAFVLQGEYRDRVRIDSVGPNKALVVAAILTTLFALGFYIHRRRRKKPGEQ
jgi:hypothetical protein